MNASKAWQTSDRGALVVAGAATAADDAGPVSLAPADPSVVFGLPHAPRIVKQMTMMALRCKEPPVVGRPVGPAR